MPLQVVHEQPVKEPPVESVTLYDVHAQNRLTVRPVSTGLDGGRTVAFTDKYGRETKFVAMLGDLVGFAHAILSIAGEE